MMLAERIKFFVSFDFNKEITINIAIHSRITFYNEYSFLAIIDPIVASKLLILFMFICFFDCYKLLKRHYQTFHMPDHASILEGSFKIAQDFFPLELRKLELAGKKRNFKYTHGVEHRLQKSIPVAL